MVFSGPVVSPQGPDTEFRIVPSPQSAPAV